MSDSPSGLEHRTPESVAVTMRHMSEAVTYLMRVASDAGLGGIVRKLHTVRDSLQRMHLRSEHAATDESKSGKPN
jgi:hypothetical protein